jgi:hypothetical protein
VSDCGQASLKPNRLISSSPTVQGLPDFSRYNITKCGKCTKLYTTNYTKWP